MTFLPLMDAPKYKSCWQRSNDAAHAFGFRVQIPVPQDKTDIIGRHLFLDIKVDYTIPLMAQATVVEIAIEREERRAVQLVQEGNYFTIFHALAAEFTANLPESDTPIPQ